MTDENDQKNQPDNITHLSQYRARLARGQRARRPDEIFASADPPDAIRALPGDEFFYLIHEVGFPDAMEIMVHGTAQQIQTVLDFAIWDKDQVSLDKSDDWLAALVEAPVEALGRWAQGIDVELLALLVRRRARIYDLSLEEAPDDPEGTLWDSPDRLFAIELLGGPDQVRVTQRMIDSLYRYSPVMMRKLLVGIRAESDAELEEEALRWRSGRMADLGFVDYFEALQAYQELDPASVRIGEAPAPRTRPVEDSAESDHLRLPTVMAERLSAKGPFARAAAKLQSREEVADLHFALVALSNRALSANRVDPSDDERIRDVLDRVSATLDLAIEFLARGDADQEGAAVRTIPLVQLHRLGASLVGKVRRLAMALRRGNPFASLRQIGIALLSYASDNDGKIPYGPKAPPFTNPADFYPSTGAPTSLISLQSGAPVGLGLMLAQQLCGQPKALFCPGSDQPLDANAELAKVGTSQAQSSYYYRHAGKTQLFDSPGAPATPDHIRLDQLGVNRNGLPIRALAIDTMFLCPPDLATYNVKPRTHHGQRFADILFSDGHVLSRPNADARYTVDLMNYAEITSAFDKILGVLEQADTQF